MWLHSFWFFAFQSPRKIGVAIGDYVLDLSAVSHFFKEPVASALKEVNHLCSVHMLWCSAHYVMWWWNFLITFMTFIVINASYFIVFKTSWLQVLTIDMQKSTIKKILRFFYSNYICDSLIYILGSSRIRQRFNRWFRRPPLAHFGQVQFATSRVWSNKVTVPCECSTSSFYTPTT